MPQVADNVTITSVDAAVQGNGRYDLFVSDTFSSNNNKAIDVDLNVLSLTPNRDNAATTGYGKAVVTLIMERLDDGGNWHPVHSLYEPIRAVSIGADNNGGIIPENQLSYGPNIFNFDGSVPIDASDGDNIIFKDHRKQGVMPAKFRFKLVLIEKEFGNGGAFDSITFNLDYELRAE